MPRRSTLGSFSARLGAATARAGVRLDRLAPASAPAVPRRGADRVLPFPSFFGIRSMLVRQRIGVLAASATIVLVTLPTSRLVAQQPAAARPAATPSTARALSLDEALRLAERESETIPIARAGVDRSRGQLMQARSQYFPQVNGALNYTRTLKSQFEILQESQDEPGPNVPPAPSGDTVTYFQPCTRYLAGSAATQAERVAALE